MEIVQLTTPFCVEETMDDSQWKEGQDRNGGCYWFLTKRYSNKEFEFELVTTGAELDFCEATSSFTQDYLVQAEVGFFKNGVLMLTGIYCEAARGNCWDFPEVDHLVVLV